MISRDRAVDFFLLVVGLAAAFWAIGFGIWTPAGGPGNGFFPVIVGCVAAIGAASSLVIDLRGAPAEDLIAPTDSLEPIELEPVGGLTKPVAYAVVMLALAIAIPFAGFYSAMGLGLWLILWPIEKTHWARALITSAVALLATYLVFDWALGVRLPHGYFF